MEVNGPKADREVPARRRWSGIARRALSLLRGRGAPRVGTVDLGDLARTTPISSAFGFDRGTPVDRYYIEQFLSAQAQLIRGRVLELGEDLYSKRFGAGITQQDVLHVREHPRATIVGDLCDPAILPADSFDCIIVTQTLHLIYDMAAAVRSLARAVRPGGVLLVTVPGVSSIDHGEWGSDWCWGLTRQSASRLFSDVFGTESIEVETHGNVYSATCFLQGLAVEEVESRWLDRHDESYPVIVAVKAIRAT